MTKSDMTTRLSTMPIRLIDQVTTMIEQGYGARGITQNSMATLKQANAVFQLVQG